MCPASCASSDDAILVNSSRQATIRAMDAMMRLASDHSCFYLECRQACGANRAARTVLRARRMSRIATHAGSGVSRVGQCVVLPRGR
jgi:hypothetical protein